MKRSIRLTALFLICSFIATAQTPIDFSKVNNLLEPATITISGDTFSYNKISPARLKEMRGWATEDYLLNDQYKKLSRDIDHLGTCVTMVAQDNSRPVQESMLLNLRNIIDDFKVRYPRFEIRTYELLYWDAKRQMGTTTENEELDEIKRKKRESAERKYATEKRKAQEVKESGEEVEEHESGEVVEEKDENAAADKKAANNPGGKTMLVVEENGTEYEVGYEEELLEQKNYKYRQRLHEYLCRFLGFKYYWVLNIPKALMTEGSFNLESAELDDKSLLIKMTPGRLEKPYGKFQINARLNKENRVTSVVITGNRASLTYLFLWFWLPAPGLSNTAKLNEKGVYIKGMFIEDVVLNMSTSTITIRPSGSIKLANPPVGFPKSGATTKPATTTKSGTPTTKKPAGSGSSDKKITTGKGASSGF